MKNASCLIGALCFTAVIVNAQIEVSGRWASDVFPMLIINMRASESTVSGSIDRGEQPVADIYDGRIDGTSITFKVKSPDSDRTIKFTGKVKGQQIEFTREVETRAGGNLGGPGIFGAAGPRMFIAIRATNEMPLNVSTPQMDQIADPEFDASVETPAFANGQPAILFDDGHFNFHTSSGRYSPFVNLLRNDGYRIASNKGRFDPSVLSNYQILVVSGAQGAEDAGDPKAAEAAFTDEECDAVQKWVLSGGALLLVADHAPHGAASSGLAQRFGVEMSNGYTTDEFNYERSRNTGSLIFNDQNGLLGDHPILHGRNEKERIHRITTFVGQSLIGPEQSTALLKLAETARDLASDQTLVSAAGRAQAIALLAGKGRVVIVGEAAALTAQVSARGKSGMSFPGSDNRQFVLNIAHWLSGLLN